jgi:NDP-sugar pyrophosphorylase family protein
LLTNFDFSRLLEFHADNRAAATMCVRKYDFQVPYGVAGIRDNLLTRIEEKPVHSFFVNAGIYVLEPNVLGMVPPNKRFDMTQLFAALIREGKKTAAFPIHEYWLDIGCPDDFQQANGDFRKVF